jgi:hypothetical protein
MRDANLRAEIWDINPEVAAAWQGHRNVSFHLDNGFSGVRSLLDRSPPGLLLIDPPYVDAEDAKDAEKLLGKAKEMGWVVLWWFMMENETIPAGSYERFELEFAKAGMDGGRWKGSVVAVAGADDGLLCRLHEQSERFINIVENG